MCHDIIHQLCIHQSKLLNFSHEILCKNDLVTVPQFYSSNYVYTDQNWWNSHHKLLCKNDLKSINPFLSSIDFNQILQRGQNHLSSTNGLMALDKQEPVIVSKVVPNRVLPRRKITRAKLAQFSPLSFWVFSIFDLLKGSKERIYLPRKGCLLDGVPSDSTDGRKRNVFSVN